MRKVMPRKGQKEKSLTMANITTSMPLPPDVEKWLFKKMIEHDGYEALLNDTLCMLTKRRQKKAANE